MSQRGAEHAAVVQTAGRFLEQEPWYLPVADEVQIFEYAYAERVPLLLKGPTGCGKTRFVEHMAWRLQHRPEGSRAASTSLPASGNLYTVACHEDLTARDLVGRYILRGGEAVWVDGPASLAVKDGGILYLDEIVEARKDVTVVLHPLSDYRRMLPVELRGETIAAPPSFMLVVSYNPGYQSVRKSLKPSTRQRFISIAFGYPPPEKETRIVAEEAGVDPGFAEQLVRLAADIRQIASVDLEEGVSTRSLIHAGRLIRRGVAPRRACSLAIAQAVSDEPDEVSAVDLIVDKVFAR